jgi:hypothetical protein
VKSKTFPNFTSRFANIEGLTILTTWYSIERCLNFSPPSTDDTAGMPRTPFRFQLGICCCQPSPHGGPVSRSQRHPSLHLMRRTESVTVHCSK